MSPSDIKNDCMFAKNFKRGDLCYADCWADYDFVVDVTILEDPAYTRIYVISNRMLEYEYFDCSTDHVWTKLSDGVYKL